MLEKSSLLSLSAFADNTVTWSVAVRSRLQLFWSLFKCLSTLSTSMSPTHVALWRPEFCSWRISSGAVWRPQITSDEMGPGCRVAAAEWFHRSGMVRRWKTNVPCSTDLTAQSIRRENIDVAIELSVHLRVGIDDLEREDTHFGNPNRYR